jgi:hypothetical protein
MSTFTIYKAGVLSFCIAIVLLFACKKEKPDIMQPIDPCACASEVSAEFVIEELATHIPIEIWIETDTTLHSKKVQFRALEENAEYTWYIGTEQFNTQAASRYFSDEWKGFNIPITLVVKKEPNKVCFPEDDGYDSITKTFHVSQYPINPDVMNTDPIIYHGGIAGTYRMFHEGLNDSIDIKVELKRENSVLARVVNFENLDGLGLVCNDTLEENVHRRIKYMTYRELKIRRIDIGHDYCSTLHGVIRNKMDGTAEMIFESPVQEDYPSNNEVVVIKTNYTGRKIN